MKWLRCGWKLRCSVLVAGTITSIAIGCRSPRPGIGTPRPRIVSLTPSVTETLFAVGVGAEVVGVSEYCDYPPQVRRLPKIGSFITPNLEAVVALRPTLVIGLPSSADVREIRALRAMGVATVAVSGDDSLAEIEASIIKIGRATGHQQSAGYLVEQIQARISSIEERLAGVAPRRVLMVVGHQPLVAVGPGTYLDELLRLAHAHNIADGSAQSWPRLSLEYILELQPDVILDGQMGTDPRAPARFWSRYPSIPAVRNRRVFGYPDDPVLHPGPRFAQTLELIARLIHPEAFAGTLQKWPQ